MYLTQPWAVLLLAGSSREHKNSSPLLFLHSYVRNDRFWTGSAGPHIHRVIRRWVFLFVSFQCGNDATFQRQISFEFPLLEPFFPVVPLFWGRNGTSLIGTTVQPVTSSMPLKAICPLPSGLLIIQQYLLADT